MLPRCPAIVNIAKATPCVSVAVLEVRGWLPTRASLVCSHGSLALDTTEPSLCPFLQNIIDVDCLPGSICPQFASFCLRCHSFLMSRDANYAGRTLALLTRLGKRELDAAD